MKKFYMTKRRKTMTHNIIALTFTFALAVIICASGWVESAIDKQDHTFVSVVRAEAIPQEIEVLEIKKETVEETIRRLAKEANFKWTDYLVRLAKCESTLNPDATNAQNNYPSHSKDRGLFQINNYWHKEVTDEQAYDLEWSTKWTMERINKGYQHEWACDRIIRNK